MKLYDLECTSCGLEFEGWVENGQPDPCRACGGATKTQVGAKVQNRTRDKPITKIPRVRKPPRPTAKLLEKMRDMVCQDPECGAAFSALAPAELGFEDLVSDACPECGKAAQIVPSLPIVSLMVNAARFKRVAKARCREDSLKEIKKEPERWGFAAANRPLGWNKRSRGPSKKSSSQAKS